MATETTNAAGVTYTNYQEDTPEAMKNEKRALLALMAEHGTEGQIEYERSKQQAKAARAASIEMAAARGAQVHAPGTLQAGLEQDYDAVMKGQLANMDDGMLGHGREMDRLAAANAAYLDQVSGASQLNRDLLDKQLAAGGGGGGGGGGRGGGGGGGGGGGDTIVAGDDRLGFLDFARFSKSNGDTPEEMYSNIDQLAAEGELTPKEADDWKRASLGWMSGNANIAGMRPQGSAMTWDRLAQESAGAQFTAPPRAGTLTSRNMDAYRAATSAAPAAYDPQAAVKAAQARAAQTAARAAAIQAAERAAAQRRKKATPGRAV